jgi:hypothetical protein
MSEITPIADQHSNTSDKKDASSRRSRKWLRGLGVLMLVLAGLSAWYLLVFYLGWQSGQTILAEKRETSAIEQLERQLALAREDVEHGSYALALRRLEWVLERRPDDSEAQALHQRANVELAALLTPEPVATVTAAPTPRPSPTSTPLPVADPNAELQRIRDLVAAENWEEAAPALIAFQWQFPSLERQASNQMLYDAYIGLGLQLLQGEQVELGLSYLDEAERLGDLPDLVTDYRIWAELYLQGIAFYDVNWGAATTTSAISVWQLPFTSPLASNYTRHWSRMATSMPDRLIGVRPSLFMKRLFFTAAVNG